MQMPSYKMFYLSRFQPLAITTYPVLSKWNLAVFSLLNFVPTLLGFVSKYMAIIYLSLPDIMTSKVLIKNTLIFSLYYKLPCF